LHDPDHAINLLAGAGAMNLSGTELLGAYRKMVSIRAFEERVHKENQTGEIPGFVHLYAGQEANAVGMCMHLDDGDVISSTHRGHGHCIAKGCDIEAMMQELYGKAGGLCGGKGGSMHIADLDKGMLGANGIVGGGPPLVVGAALSAKTLGTGKVAVCFTGDGASNQGTTFEAMNFAVVLKLPVVFVFENNGYGEFTGSDYAVGSRDIAGRAAAFGMPAVRVDGTDFFAMYEAAGAAVARARAGDGPSAIETRAVRYFGHFEGDPQNYRMADEVADLRAHHDCIRKFRARVEQSHAIDAAALDAVDVDVAALIDRAVAAARAAPFPVPAALLTDVYTRY
jgi:pyruvate dehydrogenase E1 component alpha subunit